MAEAQNNKRQASAAVFTAAESLFLVMEINKDIQTLFARLNDLIKRANRSEVGVSAFLSPRELYYAQEFLVGQGQSFVTFGGYDEAERKRIYVLPEYMDGVGGADELVSFGVDLGICVFKVSGSGFYQLSHRDFMGAVLGLGIERSVIGDIIFFEDNTAVMMCDSLIAPFLLDSLDSVGRDKVKVSRIELDADFTPPRRYAPVSDTVASARLDCVVASLCALSREKARQTVLDGAVEMNYQICEQPDREIKPVCIISVRGYGKFRVLSVDEKTKKGRYRLRGEKFL